MTPLATNKNDLGRRHIIVRARSRYHTLAVAN
jgi:hypothetical protein